MPKLNMTEITYWLSEINSCEERKKKDLITRNNYPLLIEYYEGIWRRTDLSDSDLRRQKQVFINEYFPNFNTSRADVMYQNPDISAEPTKPEAGGAMQLGEETINKADVMKGALTHAFNKMDALTENQLAYFDMFFAGYAAVEVNRIDLSEKAKAKSLFEKIKEKVTSPEEAEKKEAKQAPPKEEAYSDMDETYIRRWNPLDIGLDYRAERIKDLRYIYKIIRKTKAEFDIEYPEFKDKVTTGESVPYSLHDNDMYKKTVLIYELQIKRKRNRYETIVIAPSYKFSDLDSFDRPYTTNGFNVKIGVLDEYGKLYPISRAQINKSPQDDKNNYMTHMMEVAERNVPKRGYHKDKVKEDGLRALNSPHVNEVVPCQGGAESVWQIPHTNVSIENKELIGAFDKQLEKGFSVSISRAGQEARAKFATDIAVQEAGFQARRSDIQEGIRKLIKMELETLKDIIVQFWDDPHFFKITGGPKPNWYQPQIVPDPKVPGQTMINNALSDILTLDYDIEVDISTALRPNKEKKKSDLIEFLNFMINPAMQQMLMMQDFMVNVEFVKKTAKEFGYNPENVLTQLTPEVKAAMQAQATEGT